MDGSTSVNATSAQNSGEITSAANDVSAMNKEIAIDGIYATGIANATKSQADAASNVAKSWDPKSYARMNAS
jgi:hypothetical protein